jgi:hypothetical protein
VLYEFVERHVEEFSRRARWRVAISFVEADRSLERGCCVECDAATSGSAQITFGVAKELLRYVTALPFRADCHPAEMTGFVRSGARDCAHNPAFRCGGYVDGHVSHASEHALRIEHCVCEGIRRVLTVKRREGGCETLGDGRCVLRTGFANCYGNFHAFFYSVACGGSRLVAAGLCFLTDMLAISGGSILHPIS